MELFQMTRREMADLLLALKGWGPQTPAAFLQKVWVKKNGGNPARSFASAVMPPIFTKILKKNTDDFGFSLNEIVALGSQIENTNFTLTAIQNWVKRDIKEMIVAPEKGKKYSIEQMALLFLVEDLKTALDFDSIRKLLKLIVNDPEDEHDDLINPVQLYATYSQLFEELNTMREAENFPFGSHKHMIAAMESMITKKAEEMISEYIPPNDPKKEAIRNTIVIATLSVFTAYFQMLARRYLTATIFLQKM
ncbi:hypothetical protein BpJC7_22400 [Weizmannia acidilactici]|uniref:DUF1836 domain-containing protein n=1 Tax=Weizmannia acidilactici TaxID=2607726 RepID=A0A5J4JKQ6_9BACI|nr:DUF1836 domain-containing protein [Weizmannia acidilactici]GER68094.1 hypothetical protein BpJC4_25650 [Weizmannia acidilactici]GER70937.1 hypothetical protein BpJC7_22400 [Weizmannia acidilactici]GER73948.1 hypothetical protein BpPP18_20150 [Weizmannia acidilactici]